jgi:hypothetical protein
MLFGGAKKSRFGGKSCCIHLLSSRAVTVRFPVRLMGFAVTAALYQYDRGNRLLEETDDQGDPEVDYIYLGDLPVATISLRRRSG